MDGSGYGKLIDEGLKGLGTAIVVASVIATLGVLAAAGGVGYGVYWFCTHTVHVDVKAK